MRKTAFVCAGLLTLSLLSACESGGMKSDDMAQAGGSSDIEQLIKDADEAIKKASSAGGEWRDSGGKYLKEAKAALSKGDADTAKKLAEKAKFEGEMGYQQAMEQQNAGPWLF